MNNTDTKEKQKTQVLGVRVTVSEWDRFERKCIETGVPMSQVLRVAVKNYISNN